MRQGFLLSEYVVCLLILATLGVITPKFTDHLEKMRWHHFEQQVRFLQYRAFQNEYVINNYKLLIVEKNQLWVNKEEKIQMPNGWYANRNYRLKMSRFAPKAATIYLTNGVQKKRLVFQVGGGTFDIQG